MTKGLAQERRGMGSQHCRRNFSISMRGDKNDRRENTFSGQTPLQLKASHPWHAHVQNQASREAQLRGIQKVLRRKKSCGGVADGLQQTDCSLDDRAVVVHNRNQRNFGCAHYCDRQESDSLTSRQWTLTRWGIFLLLYLGMGGASAEWCNRFGHVEQFHDGFSSHLVHDLATMHFDRDLAGAQFARDLFVQQATNN